jgi:hypothetical protein
MRNAPQVRVVDPRHKAPGHRRQRARPAGQGPSRRRQRQVMSWRSSRAPTRRATGTCVHMLHPRTPLLIRAGPHKVEKITTGMLCLLTNRIMSAALEYFVQLARARDLRAHVSHAAHVARQRWLSACIMLPSLAILSGGAMNVRMSGSNTCCCSLHECISNTPIAARHGVTSTSAASCAARARPQPAHRHRFPPQPPALPLPQPPSPRR